MDPSLKGNKLGGIVNIEDKLKEYQSWHIDTRGMVSDEERNAFFKSLRSKPANRTCIDCMTRNPVWISTGFGVFVCLNCSGRHRQMGVHITFVRSCEMDKLPPQYLIQMDLGGNERARDFFKQHNMGPGCSKPIDYHGRWAAKYRQMLQKEVDEVMGKLHYDIPNGEVENGSKEVSSSISSSPMAAAADSTEPTATASATAGVAEVMERGRNHNDDKNKKKAAPIVIRKRPIAAPVVVKADGAAANPIPATTTHHTSSIFADNAGEVDDFFDRLEKEAAANPKPLPMPTKPSAPISGGGGFVKPVPSKGPARDDYTKVTSPTAAATVHSPTYSKAGPSYGTPSAAGAGGGAVPDRLREKRGISSDDFFDALSPSYTNPSEPSERLPASFATRQSFGSDDLTPGGARRDGGAAGMDFDDLKTSAAVAAEKGLQYASKGYEALSSYMRRQAGGDF